MRHADIQAAFLSDWDAQDRPADDPAAAHRRPDKRPCAPETTCLQGMTCRRWEPTGATRSPASSGRPALDRARQRRNPDADRHHQHGIPDRPSHLARRAGKSSFAGRRYRLPDRKTAGLSPASPSTSRHTSGGNHDSSRGSLARLAYIAENTYGNHPDHPAFQQINPTSHPWVWKKDTFQSETIRSDRQLVDFRHGVRQSNGDIGFEFRAVSFDTLPQAALMGTWSTNTLKAGTTRRSFTFERYFADIGRYRRTVGRDQLPVAGVPGVRHRHGTFGIVGHDDTGSGR